MNLTDFKPLTTPRTPGLHLSPATDEDHQWFLDLKVNYWSPIGRLNFIAGLVRPNISYAVSSLARFSEKPGYLHWLEVIHVWRYLSVTKHISLTLGPRSVLNWLICYSDATWGDNPDNRISQSSFICLFKGSPLYWTSHRQQNITHSSTESECVALSSCHLEGRWLHQLLTEIYWEEFICPLHLIDNKGLDNKIKKFGSNSKAKHINIKVKSLRDDDENGNIDVMLISSQSMAADALTKASNKISNCQLVNSFFAPFHWLVRIINLWVEGECWVEVALLLMWLLFHILFISDYFFLYSCFCLWCDYPLFHFGAITMLYGVLILQIQSIHSERDLL